MKYIISACLIGCNCRYDGKSKPNTNIENLYKQADAIIVCPELLGKLPTPRDPAEIVNEKVITIKGDDVTNQFQNGTQIALYIALEYGCTHAILKANSPSCGYGDIYDGTFTGTLKEGNGIFAQKLLEHKISIQTEEDFQ